MRGQSYEAELAEWFSNFSEETRSLNADLLDVPPVDPVSRYREDNESGSRSDVGRISQAIGDTFEGRVGLMNLSVGNRGCVFFCGHRTKTSRNKEGGLITINTGDGPPDIMGTVDGLPVIFEVKTKRTGKSFRFVKQNWHQFEAIQCAGLTGAFSGAFIWWVQYEEYRWHNWDTFSSKGVSKVSNGIVVNHWIEAFDLYKERIIKSGAAGIG